MPARVLGVGVRVAAANIWTAIQTFGSGLLKLRNPAGTFTYIFKGGAIVADRDVTMPLLTGNDVLVTEGMAQTLTNKTIGVASMGTGATTLTGVVIGAGTGALAGTALTALQSIRMNTGGTAYEGFTPAAGTVTSVTGTAPLASSGGATPDISVTGAAGQVLAGATPAFTATPTLGASGTLGSVTLGNATSGLLTVQPVTGALGTVTVSLPAATDTLVGKATTDTLTNKTLTSPVLTTPALGTPASGVMTNVTGIPEGALALTDITTANASATAHGFVPKWPNNTTTFFRGDGTYAAPGGGGAVTREGGNTTEATTTSTTIVNLLSTTVSIGANIFTEAICSLRKTAGAANSASIAFKVNTTQTSSAFAFTDANNGAAPGFVHVRFQTPQTNYHYGGTMLYGSQGLTQAHGSLIGTENLPVATYTAIVFMGLVGSASITMGADEMHVYTYAVS